MPYLTSSTNHSPNPQPQPYTPTEPTMPSSAFASHRNSAAPHHNVDLNQHRGSGDFNDSRRGSVDSRMYQGLDALRLNGPTSPYNQSANVSQTSLASSLQQQRGIHTNGSRLSNSSVPISPHWSRNSMTSRNPIAGRIAPPIMEHPRDRSQFAAEPTRGQPWAFPDPDESAIRPESVISRRNSQASFSTNSLYSELNRPLPPGQHGMRYTPIKDLDTNPLTELPDHHHHTAMPSHSRISSLREDPESPTGSTPYSRTPELRITHKIAERKRRGEMKDYFEQLGKRLPAGQNNKSSKGEILLRGKYTFRD